MLKMFKAFCTHSRSCSPFAINNLQALGIPQHLKVYKESMANSEQDPLQLYVLI